MTESPNGWDEWGKFVLKELERLNGCYESVDGRLNKIVAEIAKLKVKSGVWGLVGGAILVITSLGIWLLKSQ